MKKSRKTILAKHPAFREAILKGVSAKDAHEAYIRAGGIPMHERTVRRAAEAIRGPSKPGPKLKDEFTMTQQGDNMSIIAPPRGRIMTEEELIEACKVDRTVWEPERQRVNKWDMTTGDGETHQNFQVRVDFKRIPNAQAMKTFREEMVALAKAGAPRITAHKKKKQSGDRCLLEVNLPDLHVGKYAWEEETGEDYDSDIAVARGMEAIESLIARTPTDAIERCQYVVGNDFLHFDNERVETTAGTRQDADTRYARMFRMGVEFQFWAIERLHEIAPVDVVCVPGNHDFTTTFALGEVLAARFANASDIRIDNNPKPRKRCRFGATLIGYTHGNEEKHQDLPMIMVQEWKKDFSDTHFHEWHIGHFHKKRETKFTAGDTLNGVNVIVLPSLSGTDWWHHKKGYIHTYVGAEARLYDYHTGPAGYVPYNIVVGV